MYSELRVYVCTHCAALIRPTKEARISVDNFQEFLLAPMLLSRTARLPALQSRSRALSASREAPCFHDVTTTSPTFKVKKKLQGTTERLGALLGIPLLAMSC